MTKEEMAQNIAKEIFKEDEIFFLLSTDKDPNEWWL